jgi:hypothetical protein
MTRPNHSNRTNGPPTLALPEPRFTSYLLSTSLWRPLIDRSIDRENHVAVNVAVGVASPLAALAVAPTVADLYSVLLGLNSLWNRALWSHESELVTHLL